MALVAEQRETSKAEGQLDVGDLCRMFEESEDSSYESRKNAERDRDYYDNKQLTADEIAELKNRGQPPTIDNRIKTKVDYLVGLEKTQRVKPKAFPRTPKHEADADSATEALRYVAESEDYSAKRSGVWKNMLLEGVGGFRVYAEPSKYGQPPDYMGSSSLSQQEYDICLQRIAWDRLFFDPHSAEADFSDAGYLGIVTWMDYDDALAMYPDGQDILDTTLSSAPSETYDDKPKFTHWADKKRKRVRIVQIWVKRNEQWFFAEYTKGGILKAGASPYQTDKGESDCELLFQSAYVDRDNNRYGLVREMISLQDEINKRRSKSLDLLVRNQVTYEEGAVEDIEEYRKQRARTDGVMKVNPGALSNQNGPRIVSETKADLAIAHANLLQEAKNSIDLKGPNATEMGDKTQGSSSASGKAIIASQQGGMIQIGDLMDNLRHLDKRVYRAVWARIRQYWRAEKWIRVTDDEQNVKWLGINLDPMQMQQMKMRAAQDPRMAEQMKESIAGMTGPVAELDCDIIIDDAPDSLTPQLEQFQSLVELKKFDTGNEIPFRAIVAAMPNLKDKQNFLKALDEQAEKRQGQPDPETAKLMAQEQAKQAGLQQQAKLKEAELVASTQAEERKLVVQAQIERDKLAAKVEADERAAAIEIQKNREMAVIERQKAEDAYRLKLLELQATAVNEREKLGAQIEGERVKADLTRETERERAAITQDTERRKIDVQREANREKMNMDRERDKEKVAGENKARAEDPVTQKLTKSVEALGSKVDGMGKEIKEIARKAAAPKRLIRDKQGNIIGAEPVERLEA